MSYLGLMLDRTGTIRGIRTLDCADDQAAIDAARDALERSTATAVEVWRDRDRVGKLYRPISEGS